MEPTQTMTAAPVDGPTPDLVGRLRSVVDLRRKPTPLADFIPLCQQAADAITAARTEAEQARKQRDQLLAALRDIANPLTKLREQAQEAGCVLDGAMVVQLVNDPHWLRAKAKTAVAAAERLAGDKTE